MRRTVLVTAGILIAAGALAWRRADDGDAEAIRRTVQYYFDGSRGADSSVMRRAFHVGAAKMMYVRGGRLVEVPIAEFIARSGRRRATEFVPDTFPRRIVSIDVAGNSATAKLEMVTPELLVVDYMALLKVDGEWLIVNKIFDRVPR